MHENHQNSGFLKRQFGGRIAREIQIRYVNDSSMNGEELKYMFWQKHVKAIVVGVPQSLETHSSCISGIFMIFFLHGLSSSTCPLALKKSLPNQCMKMHGVY